ncbi:MAG: ABC transporter substrate-binding protein, partial [Clostridiales bacterium]|nr:ABC transporter substrate-binding protein [Clostridiales bacterium]
TMVLDNTVVQYLDVVLESADEAKIPVFGSEIEQVKRGCVAAQGLDYIELGRMTGVLAARVLKGEDAASIPFQMVEDSQLYVNFEACERLGITLTEDLTARAIRTEAE